MLDFEFENSFDGMTVTFYIEDTEVNDYCEVARFHFNDRAFDSVEEALSLLAGLVGNNFSIETSFGCLSIRTDEYVYYDDVPGVEGYAEIKNFGYLFDEYLDVRLYYPESIGVNEIYRLIDEDLDIKSFKPNIEQLFDF